MFNFRAIPSHIATAITRISFSRLKNIVSAKFDRPRMNRVSFTFWSNSFTRPTKLIYFLFVSYVWHFNVLLISRNENSDSKSEETLLQQCPLKRPSLSPILKTGTISFHATLLYDVPKIVKHVTCIQSNSLTQFEEKTPPHLSVHFRKKRRNDFLFIDASILKIS